jgi:hypothetical protein
LGAAIAILNHLEDSPVILRLQANVCVAAAQTRKEAPDIVDLQQAPIPEADRSVLASDVVARVPSTWWLKKEEAKTK